MPKHMTEAASASFVRIINYGAVLGEKVGPVGVKLRGTNGPTFGTPAKFGTNSLKADTYVLQYPSLVPDPGVEGITIEHWFYSTALPAAGSPNINLCWGLGSDTWAGINKTSGKYQATFSSDTTQSKYSAANLCDGQWHHIVVQMSRVAGVTIDKGVWIDGVALPGVATTVARAWNSNFYLLGFELVGFDSWNTGGFSMDEVRISKGLRYTQHANLTVPTAPYSVDDKTLLLHHAESINSAVPNLGYPSRPAGAQIVEFVGPEEPTSVWLDNDRWLKV